MNMNLKLASYTGKFVYEELYTYFSAFSKKAQEELKKSRTSSQDEFEPESSETKIVREIQKQGKFKKMCLEDNCYLLIINGNSENAQKSR